MDPETNAKMVYMMGPFIKKFNGIHLNKLLVIKGKEFKDLPMMPKHISVSAQADTISAILREAISLRILSSHYAIKSGQM